MKRLKILIFVLAAYSLCASAAPKIIGHRGSAWGVENTAEAFINGAKEGYDCLETDIKVTKDGKFVCWHDDNLSLTPSNPTIYTTNYSDLKSLTLTQTKGGVTYTGTICTLEEYLDICKQYNVTPIIELKWATGINSNDQSNMDEFMQVVIDKGFRNKCYIFTSMKPCLQYVKTNYPDVETMLLCYSENFDSSLQWCIANDCHIGTDVGTEITKAGVKKYHDVGLLVNAWTIDSKSTYDTYAGYGCDFITTNSLQTEDLPSDDGGDGTETSKKVTFQTVWERSTTLGNAPSNIDGTYAQQGSAHNGVFYVNNIEEKKLHIFSSGAQYLGSVAGGSGYGIDCDDAGNVIIRDENATDGNHKFIIYPAGATVSNSGTPVTFDVKLPISGETHFISASGDVLGNKGGYIYMFPNGQTSVCVIPVANGKVGNVILHDDLLLTGSTAGYVIPMDNNPNKWIYQVRNNGYYLYNNGTSTQYQAEKSSIIAPDRNSSVGGEYFKLGGEEYFIHSSGENYKGGFTVRNRTTNEVVTSVDPIGTLGYEAGGNYSVANWVRAEAIDNYSCYIYQYCPANGMAVYKMSIPNPNDDGNDEPLEGAVFTLETEWQRGTALGNAPSNIDGVNTQQGSAHNGIFYINNKSEKKLLLFGSEAQYLGSIPGGAGYGCDCDDVGNIIIRNDVNGTSSFERKFIIYPAGATVDNYGTAKEITVTLPTAENANFITASGNVLGSEGGYIYIYPDRHGITETPKIYYAYIIPVANGQVTGEIITRTLSSSLTPAGGSIVIPVNNDPNKFYYQSRSNGTYKYDNGTNTSFLTAGNQTAPGVNSTGGAEYFKLAGHEFYIHNSGTNYLGGFTIKNLTTGEVITSVAPIGNVSYNSGNGNASTSNWLRAETIDNYSCYIYQYCPANGMAVYKFSTPAPVTDDEEDDDNINESGETYTLSDPIQQYETTFSGNEASIPGSNYKQAAVVNDVFFTAAGAANQNTQINMNPMYYSKIRWVDLKKDSYDHISGGGPSSSTGASLTFPYASSGAYCHVGPACTVDDGGTLWFVTRRGSSTSWYEAPSALMYGTPSTSGDAPSYSKSAINLTTNGYNISGRCDLMSSYGNCTSGTGYLWFAPHESTNLERLTVSSKNVVLKTPFNAPAVPGAGVGFAKQFSSNRIVWQPAVSNGNYGIIQIGTINENAKTISWENTGLKVYRHGLTAFNLGNCEIIAYSSSNTEITLYDYTNKKDLLTITPFEASSTSDWTSHSIEIKVSGNDITMYVFVPGVGAKKYTITATKVEKVIPTDNLESLDYHYVLTSVDGGERQDIELTWVAPDEVAPTGYKIYRNGSLIANISGAASNYTDEGVSENNTYLVVPIFEGAAENAGLGLEVTTTEVTTILYAPIITETRSYDGYSIAQIFFKMPKLSKVKPTYFNIYRGNELLVGEITQYNYIDENLPQTADAQTYEYRVEAVYAGATYNNATRMSDSKSVEVTPRDWALVGYNIEEIYNVPISEIDAAKLPGLFNEKDYYRQGHFYDGYWYIAQRADGVYSANDEYIPVDPNTTGGVIKIKATNEADVLEGMASKPISYAPYVSVGLAMDEKGTIFVRNNDLEKLVATTPLDGDPTKIAGIKDGFGRRITEGLLYVRDANGEYTAAPIELDLTKLWTDNRWIDEMYFNTAKSYGQVAGRSDYYYMWGDVMSAEGGYLILSPTWTRTAFKVKIANGVYVSHEVIQFESYDEFNEYTGDEEHHIVGSGTENYGFKIAGRDAWMAQIRSNGYYGVHDDEVGEEKWHAIFDADSRINNSGGTSIVAFNETFLITPACMYSNNIGDFIVTRGTKESVNVSAADAELAPPMPVAQFKQADRSTNIATNSNGNWFHAELGTYVSADDEAAECVYIYQYVPGVRFAKYRLYPDDQLKPIIPTLSIVTAYDNEKTEITHFNGVSTWKRPQEFGIAAGDNAHAKVKSYTYELLNDKGEVIYSEEIIDNDYANNTPPTDFSDDFVYTFNFDQTVNEEIKHTLDFQTYTARVAVNYEIVDEAAIRQSEFGYARANNSYDALPAEDLGVWVFKKTNTTQQVWEEVNGKWEVVDKQVDSYRVELDFNKPDHEEPVSYYTIKAIVNNQTDTIDIVNFNLHQGMEVVNGIEQAKVIEASQIQGTYDFDNDKAPYYHKVGSAYGSGGQSRQNCVLTWHHIVPAGYYTSGVATAANGDEVIITDEPNKWIFIVDAHYAARNRYIAKSADNNVAPEGQEMIETSVELIGDDNVSSVQIYPIPASTTITIKANEAINSIVVYNEAGVEMMKVDGNGDNMTELNIENLSTGYYFVKVNNTKPVKIIKK